MTELRYLPSAWMDESIPDPEEDPNSFIHRAGDNWFLRPTEEDEDDENYSQRLQHGDIVMFDENRVFGDFTLIIEDDGRWLTTTHVPAQANCFRLERENETISHSIDDLISLMEMKEGEYSIDAYWWSDYEVPLRFVAEGETARFERIEGTAQ